MDKTISELEEAVQVNPDDKFVLEQAGAAKRLTGDTLEKWLLQMTDGHGGIRAIRKSSTSGLVDTYTITLADESETTFTVTNGAKGDRGERGFTGPAPELKSARIEYTVGENGTMIPAGQWSEEIPAVPQGKFLWTRVHMQFAGSDPVVIAFSARNGIDGAGTVSAVCGVSPGTDGDVLLTASNVGAASKRSAAVVLAVSSWNGKVQTVQVPGVKAASDVFVAPEPSLIAEYAENAIRCISQGSGSLTFECESIPSENITVNIAILD